MKRKLSERDWISDNESELSDQVGSVSGSGSMSRPTDGTTSSSDGEGERNSSGGAFSSLDSKL